MRKTLAGLLVLGTLPAAAQFQVFTDYTPQQLVEDVLVGSCVEVNNVTYNGQETPFAPEGLGRFTSNSTNMLLPAGVILTSGYAENIAQSAGNLQSDSHMISASDVDLVTISGGNINNAAVLEFDFVPQGDTLRFRYVFASEEYPEYVCSFNDAFAFLLSGPGITGPYSNNSVNIALIPGTTTPVTINNVNNGLNNNPNHPTCPAQNPEYFIDNGSGGQIVYDGMTVVLEAVYPVVCGEVHHIKLAIGDALDSALDSGVFIEAGSFSSVPLVPEIAFEGGVVENNLIFESCVEYEFNLAASYCDEVQEQTVYLTYGGTATMGVDIVPALPDSVLFIPGQPIPPILFTAPIDADGDETFVITMVAIDCNGEPVTAVFEFTITSMPPLTITGTGGEFLCGQSVPLVPQVTGAIPVYTYLWSTNETTPTISPSPTESTTYTVTVSDPCGVSASHDFEVTLLPAPPMPVSIVGDNTLLEGCEHGLVLVQSPEGNMDELTITVSYGGTATPGEDYTFGPTLTVPAGAGSAEFPFTTLADQITEGAENAVITITLTNACAQTVGDTVEFVILNVDPFSVHLDDIHDECRPDSMLVFVDVEGGTPAFTYIWSTGDTIVGDNSAYIPLDVEMNVVVTVIDGCGTTVTGSFALTLDCIPEVPNVFTPNGDGHNDFFQITGTAGRPTQVRIFNRWGQMVFDAPNYQNNWRATDMPEGTYFYEVLIRDEEPITGHLTILRDSRSW